MNTPIFSVVIPTYNRPRQLKRCLMALTKQAYQGNWQVVVVDDGSEQCLNGLIASFENQLHIKLLEQTNQGPAAARNLGARQARGQFLAFLDDDCEPDINWLASFVPHLKLGVLLGGRTENKLSRNIYSEVSQHLVSYLYERFRGTPWYFFTSNNVAVDRDTFLTLGGFDASFHTSAGEDRGFCVYWAKQGKRLLYIPDAIVEHSHDLNLFSFCKLHVKYGQAAKHFKVKLQDWGVEPVPVRLSFYTDLLVFCFKQSHYSMGRKLSMSWLLTLSQVCTLWGIMRGSGQYQSSERV